MQEDEWVSTFSTPSTQGTYKTLHSYRPASETVVGTLALNEHLSEALPKPGLSRPAAEDH